MSKLTKEWERKKAYFERSGSKLYLRRQTPFKTRLQRAVNKLEAQGQVIENAINHLTERDKQLFSKITDSYSLNDPKRANIYANELTEVRKTVSFMLNVRLTLEKTALRLSTMHQLGNAAITLSPAVKALKTIQTGISNILPSTDREIGSISDILNQIISESGQTSGIALDTKVASKGADDILKEAAMIAEQKIKDKLPETPGTTILADDNINRQTEVKKFQTS